MTHWKRAKNSIHHDPVLLRFLCAVRHFAKNESSPSEKGNSLCGALETLGHALRKEDVGDPLACDDMALFVPAHGDMQRRGRLAVLRIRAPHDAQGAQREKPQGEGRNRLQ